MSGWTCVAQLLDTLKENDPKAIWFIIGNHMNKCPEVMERIHAAGVLNGPFPPCSSTPRLLEENTSLVTTLAREWG